MGHFCIDCGAALVMKNIEGRDYEACPNDEYVLWRDPKVATAVVVEVGDGVVLGRRGIEPGYGLWCLPGGFVNDDEDPARAAVRECAEEINATVELTGLLGVYHVGKTTSSSIVGIAYRGRVADRETISPGSEMLEVAVFSMSELPPIAFPSHEAVLAAYLRSPERPVGAELLNAAGAARPGAPPSQARGPRTPPRPR